MAHRPATRADRAAGDGAATGSTPVAIPDRLNGWLGSLLALLAGASLVLAFAPFEFWPAAILAPAVLFGLIRRCTPGRSFRLGWWFGLGQFGLGVSWVYESFTLFGGIVAPLAVLVTSLFVMGLAFYPAVSAWLAVRVTRRGQWPARAAAFAASWVLIEALRAWLFGGFPWLNLGISQVDGPLVGWLPIVGEYGVSAILLVLAVAVWRVVSRLGSHGPDWRRWVGPVALISAVLLASLPLQRAEWSQPNGSPLTVGLVQGNIAQMQKFDPAFFQRTLSIYRDLTASLPAVDLIVWPETAIPRVIGDLPDLRAELDALANDRDATLLAGTFTRDAAGRYYNALLGFPESAGEYRKRHLVPFGEYFPLRGLIERMPWLFEVPMSDLSPGPSDQAPLRVDGVMLGASICFEADFSRDIRATIPTADVLVTVSNDSWFGDSFSPHQHLQMARARAIEFQRPLARATNTGISAIIDTNGRVREILGTGEQGVLTAELQPRRGNTPLALTGAWPVLGLMLLVLAVAGWRSRVMSRPG
ncbi:apolipoprotein N-acyltransferase [Guyparkeria halophila]|uniref:Apolipoprotein N-acyltransferase n=1 Tax=Guyparkeria halophila TaxID=47960 RepID=A0A6I6CWI4_9GAMM|nr:apolipoprotein N-acyltransferase [Guyparkeria halophila]QGT78489.1 apolipoprotein N-acyltransferase [Guyparkeria halophila]